MATDPLPERPRKATCYTVQYGRDGWSPGSLFISRNGPFLELTSPLQIIRIRGEDVAGLAAELARLAYELAPPGLAPSAGA